VEGIDASAAMVDRLRAKPGGASIPVVIGDLAEVPAAGPFGMAYLVFNSLFGLLSQARQALCFGNPARVLGSGGVFVIERFVPDLSRFDRDQRVQARAVTEDSAVLEVSRHDAAHQRVTTQIVTFDGQGTHLRPVALRYSWPRELDLMAQQAGLRLRERYAAGTGSHSTCQCRSRHGVPAGLTSSAPAGQAAQPSPHPAAEPGQTAQPATTPASTPAACACIPETRWSA
jgi:hypothetical protein